MHLRTVRLSSKGQLTIPADILRAINAGKGTEFLLVEEHGRLVLVKAREAAEAIVDDLADLHHLSGPSFARVWDNEEDEVWNDVALIEAWR